MAGKVELVNYNPEWPKMFKEESRQLKSVMGKNCVAIYHIGSTAVKGMQANPIIDILAVVKDLNHLDQINTRFEAAGYECMGEYGNPGRRFYRKGGQQPTHHVHVFEQSNQADIQRHLAVVQYLSGNERRCEEYSQMKAYLAQAYPDDIDGYQEGKAYFMSQLEQEALNHQQPEQEQEENPTGGRSVGVSIGMCIGLVLGFTVFENIGVGLCVGLAIGIIVRLIESKAKKG